MTYPRHATAIPNSYDARISEAFAIVATGHVWPYETRDLEKAFRVVFDWAVTRDLVSHMCGGVPLDDELYDAGFDAAYDTLYGGVAATVSARARRRPDTTPEPDLATDVFLPVM